MLKSESQIEKYLGELVKLAKGRNYQDSGLYAKIFALRWVLGMKFPKNWFTFDDFLCIDDLSVQYLLKLPTVQAYLPGALRWAGGEARAKFIKNYLHFINFKNRKIPKRMWKKAKEEMEKKVESFKATQVEGIQAQQVIVHSFFQLEHLGKVTIGTNLMYWKE